jgi:hypothetical protein
VAAAAGHKDGLVLCCGVPLGLAVRNQDSGVCGGKPRGAVGLSIFVNARS